MSDPEQGLCNGWKKWMAQRMRVFPASVTLPSTEPQSLTLFLRWSVSPAPRWVACGWLDSSRLCRDPGWVRLHVFLYICPYIAWLLGEFQTTEGLAHVPDQALSPSCPCLDRDRQRSDLFTIHIPFLPLSCELLGYESFPPSGMPSMLFELNTFSPE